MTNKAKAVLQKMKLRKLFPSRIPQSASEPVATAGSDQGVGVLNESNDFQAGHDAFVRSFAPNVVGC